jgi:AcrR family transcriptional regulator
MMKRREKVLESATWLFGYYGFEKTTVDDIAEKAGVSKGSVYLEFQNKEAILIAVVQQFTAREMQRIQALVHNCKPPYLDCLKKLLYGHVMAYWDIASGHLHSPEVIASANPAIMSELLSFQSAVFMQIAYILEKAASEKEITNAPDYYRLGELVCYSLVVLFPPYDRLKASNPQDFNKTTLEEYANELIQLVFAGLKTNI